MKQAMFEESGRAYVVWTLLLAALLGGGIAANVVLHRQVAQWRDRNPAFHWAEAERLVAEKDYVGAKVELARALALAPDRPEPYAVSGRLHYALKHWEPALDAYRHAIAKGGQNPHFYGRALWCLIHLGRFEEAAELGITALDNGVETPNLRRYIGEAYRRGGKPEQAIPFFEAELATAPNSVDLMNSLVAAYRATGRQEQADALVARIEEAQAQLETLLAPDRAVDESGGGAYESESRAGR